MTEHFLKRLLEGNNLKFPKPLSSRQKGKNQWRADRAYSLSIFFFSPSVSANPIKEPKKNHNSSKKVPPVQPKCDGCYFSEPPKHRCFNSHALCSARHPGGPTQHRLWMERSHFRPQPFWMRMILLEDKLEKYFYFTSKIEEKHERLKCPLITAAICCCRKFSSEMCTCRSAFIIEHILDSHF